MKHSPIIFFGSDQYSAIVLRSLISKNCPLFAVIIDRPKPKDSSQIIEPNPVAKLAIKHKLKVLYYPTNQVEMNNFISTISSTIHDLPSTIGLCASFDHLLPASFIKLFNGHLYNLHPSLLPQYRNVSPVQYAIALGDIQTGITLFRITTGIDNGKIIAQLSKPIQPTDTTPTLTSRLFKIGTTLFLEYLNTPGVKGAPHSGSAIFTHSSKFKINHSEWIFTHRLTRDSGFVEWSVLQQLLTNKPISPSETSNDLLRLRLQRILASGLKFGAWSLVLSDLIRSLTPWPGVWTIANTIKGPLRISLTHSKMINDLSKLQILISGKPKPISWDKFTKYYLYAPL